MNYIMVFQLLGGLGLFIYGMKLMGDGLEKAAGDKLKKILEVLTTNRFMGVLVGTGVTSIIQSSSATTVMVIGFVNAGLMSLSQAAGVIMGANIGTTMTAQLIAFKLDDIAPLILAIGAVMYMFSSKKKVKDIGGIVLGFGILFVGMHTMSTAMKPLSSMPQFQNLILTIGNHPFMGVLVGLAMTATVQSSSATIGILMALAAGNTITLGVALPILFGDNIGTCATALLASIGTNKNAKRAALIHLTFNVIGTVIFMSLFRIVLNVIPMLGGDIQRQIANAHTLFNVTNVLIQVWFIKYLVIFVNKLVPGEEEDGEKLQLLYLDRRLLETPSIAVGQVIKEVVRMGKLALKNLDYSIDSFIKGDNKLISKVAEGEEVINYLEREITGYLVALSNLSLSEHQSEIIGSLYHTVNDIERIGDHAENMTELTDYKLSNNLKFSDTAIDEIKKMADLTKYSVEQSVKALELTSLEAAKDVIVNEQKIDDMEKSLRAEHIERLNKYICDPASGAIFLDALVNLERIGDHANNIAEAVLNTK
ncbi:MAG: Na/Pi cotransporter family protein [Bacillota bacterium]|nr:Na/Pi cotransporter family protein [Bacillota bacterium]